MKKMFQVLISLMVLLSVFSSHSFAYDQERKIKKIVKKISKKANLDSAQSEKLKTIFLNIHEKKYAVRKSQHELAKIMNESLTKDNFSDIEINAAYNKINAGNEAVKNVLLQSLEEIHSSFTPKQREVLAQYFSHHGKMKKWYKKKRKHKNHDHDDDHEHGNSY